MIFLSSLILLSCAPVLNKDYLREGQRDLSFNELRQNPGAYKGKLFVFGGVIIETRLTEEGSRIEAMHVPVDRYGYFNQEGRSEGRFLAILPNDGRMLDPEAFGRGRRISLAAEFIELRKGRIDEMDYRYPVFQIRQIHLWPKERRYYPAYYYDPWFYPYPYYFWDPWWSYPYYYYQNYRYRGGPIYRRIPPPNQPPPSRSPRPHQRPDRSPESGGFEGGPERAPERGRR